MQTYFSLKGTTSILIGVYICIAAYLTNSILIGFSTDNNTLGMLSPEIIEILITTLLFLVFLFSSLAIYFKGKRKAKKDNNILLNKSHKTSLIKYLLSLLVIFTILFILLKKGLVNYLTPSLLFSYTFLHILLYKTNDKNTFTLPIVSFFLAIICFLIPSYWNAALSILGIAHITYGVVAFK